MSLLTTLATTTGSGGTATPPFASIPQPAGTVIRLMQVQPGSTGRGPFVWEMGGATFSGEYDHALYNGYNVASGGTQRLAGEPYCADVLESDFNELGFHWLERYIEYSTPNGSHVRPFFLGFDKSTNNVDLAVNRFFLSAPSISLMRPSDSLTFVQFQVGLTQFAQGTAVGTNTLLVSTNHASATSALILGQGTAGQLVLLHSGTGTGAISIGGKTPIRFQGIGSTNTGQDYVYINTNFGDAALLVSPGSNFPAAATILARNRSGQTGAIFAAATSADAILSQFDKNGYFMTRKVAAPADADLASSEMALWFDATNGAGKLMIKAKTANGTVVTGSVALA